AAGLLMHRSDRLSSALIGAGATLAALVVTVIVPGHAGSVHRLIVAESIALLSSALLRAYSEVRAYESESKRYWSMASTFQMTAYRLAELADRGNPREER